MLRGARRKQIIIYKQYLKAQLVCHWRSQLVLVGVPGRIFSADNASVHFSVECTSRRVFPVFFAFFINADCNSVVIWGSIYSARWNLCGLFSFAMCQDLEAHNIVCIHPQQNSLEGITKDKLLTVKFRGQNSWWWLNVKIEIFKEIRSTEKEHNLIIFRTF